MYIDNMAAKGAYTIETHASNAEKTIESGKLKNLEKSGGLDDDDFSPSFKRRKSLFKSKVPSKTEQRRRLSQPAASHHHEPARNRVMSEFFQSLFYPNAYTREPAASSTHDDAVHIMGYSKDYPSLPVVVDCRDLVIRCDGSIYDDMPPLESC